MPYLNEVPARAFINAQIIMEVRNQHDFQEAVRTVINYPAYRDTLGIIGYQFENHAYVLSLLYCLIVVPKELWANLDNNIYKTIDRSKLYELFEVITDDANLPRVIQHHPQPSERLIYRLRNSISHANISTNEQMDFSFWDMPPGNQRKEWEVRITAANIMKFLTEIGTILANEGLRRNI